MYAVFQVAVLHLCQNKTSQPLEPATPPVQFKFWKVPQPTVQGHWWDTKHHHSENI